MNVIQLIVGLGNPGTEYQLTRHNAGSWLVEAVADRYQQTLRLENKFLGLVTRVNLDNNCCYLLIPTTYMNLSGQAIHAISNYYKIPPRAILVVHDDVDFPPGSVRFKQGGGHGGHNGLRNIIAQLGDNNFMRLRIGIGHPGSREQVLNYVLGRPSQHDQQAIDGAIDDAISVLPDIIAGDAQRAMQFLHNQ